MYIYIYVIFKLNDQVTLTLDSFKIGLGQTPQQLASRAQPDVLTAAAQIFAFSLAVVSIAKQHSGSNLYPDPSEMVETRSV